jgi:AAA+ ATPase superfamily predicted ATPase
VEKRTLMPAMNRYFNIAGPCNPEEHYMLPSELRCHEVMDLIRQKQYFVIHAARQSGKTTLLLDLVNKLNATGEYYALYCSLKSLQSIDDPAQGISVIIGIVQAAVENIIQINFKLEEPEPHNMALRFYISHICKSLDKPLVLFFDNTECLTNSVTLSFLPQIREGHNSRCMIPFAHSMGFVGTRILQNHKGKIWQERKARGNINASVFNIITETMSLPDFSRKETAQLLAQHTLDTGRKFSPEVLDRIFHYTQGQPWLVNAVALQVVESDPGRMPTPEHVDQAVETIISGREFRSHNLLGRLRENATKKYGTHDKVHEHQRNHMNHSSESP